MYSMKQLFFFVFPLMLVASIASAQLKDETNAPLVQTTNGMLEGVYASGIKIFKGIPYAKPPVGNLRWREPQPIENWKGVRKADKFGPRPMQIRTVYSDMVFRSDSISEDCLYLNVWTPATSSLERLPVLVYFFGGGFRAGDGSEYRYDGESMARKGIVAVTVNYRLNVFGFLAHPELTKESPHHASGNYGLMDQAAALQWVSKNIAAFGGDPKRITIGGESAGSFSVSAQIASPLSKNLIAGAIGESGSFLGLNAPLSLAETEKMGVEFADSVGAKSLAELRALPAKKLLEATSRFSNSRFRANIDGYFFPKSPLQIFTAGEQAHVPLLVGWNSEEDNYKSILGENKPTKENFIKAVQEMYRDRSSEILKVYNPSADSEVKQVATELASARFIAFGTWRWSELQSKTGGKAVYRYLFSRPRPLTRLQTAKLQLGQADGSLPNDTLASALLQEVTNNGAIHSTEIEYALGNLPSNRVFDWQPEDFKVSEIMQTYFANFIKIGNPNGVGLPVWPLVQTGKTIMFMHIDVNTRAEAEKNRQRYLSLESTAKH